MSTLFNMDSSKAWIDTSQNGINNHAVYFGTSGKGKSLFSVRAQQEARASGALYVDTGMYRANKGLLPYEHEYARRLVLGIYGRLPRELRGKRVTTVVSRDDTVRSGKTKMGQKHTVRTSSGIIDLVLVNSVCSFKSPGCVELNPLPLFLIGHAPRCLAVQTL